MHDKVKNELTHYAPRWTHQLDIECTAEEVQAAVSAGVLEARERKRGGGMEYRVRGVCAAPKHYVIGTTCTPAERTKVRKAARQQGLTVSQLVRTALESVGVL